jgi:DnaJ homolog subfamily B member 4
MGPVEIPAVVPDTKMSRPVQCIQYILLALLAGQTVPDAALPATVDPCPVPPRRAFGVSVGVGGAQLHRLRGGTAPKYYRALGLEGPGATPEEIKRAYKRQALRWHPDRCKPDDKLRAEEKFKELSEAYETLSDPNRKAFYDRWGDDGIKAQNGREPSRDEARRGPAGMRRRDYDVRDFRDPFDLFREFFGAEDEGFAGMGGGGLGGGRIGRDVFGHSVFHGPGGVRVVVGSGTSAMSMLLQVLIGAVDRWASRQREEQGSARPGAPQARLRRYHLMVPCSLSEVMTGCNKTLAAPPGTQQAFDIQVGAGWKDGTLVTFVGDNDEGPWEVVCVIRVMPHAHFVRDGNDLRYRVCVTAAKLHQLHERTGCMRVSVPLLVPSAAPACHEPAQKAKRGKGNTRGTRRARGVRPASAYGAVGRAASAAVTGLAAAFAPCFGYAWPMPRIWSSSAPATGAGDGDAQQDKAGDGADGEGGMVKVEFDESTFELSFPPWGILGHKICEERVRGEGMSIRGQGANGEERGDLIVELLVGNRLQAALMSSGLVSLILSIWGVMLHWALEQRNALLLLWIHCLRSAVVRRVEAEWARVYVRASACLAPAMPAIKEALVHLALFGLSTRCVSARGSVHLPVADHVACMMWRELSYDKCMSY